MKEPGATAGRSPRVGWRKLHTYIALAAGCLFVFSGLTGSALVFYQAIDEYLNPALLTVEPRGEYAPLADILAAARARAPDEAELTRVYFPRHSRAAMQARFALRHAGEGALLDVLVDPFTAEVLGQRQWGGHLMSFLYELHHTLFLGDRGKTLIGIAGLLLMMASLSGLYLWWPRGERRRRFAVRRRAKRSRSVYRWHMTLGAYAGVGLMVAAFSGFSMIFPQAMKTLVGVVLPFGAAMPAPVSGKRGEQRISIAAAARTATALFPQAQLQRIYPPASAGGVYRVILRQPDEIRKTSGSTRVWIDPHDGKILAVQEPKTLAGGDAVLAWMFPLHNGEALGLTGRMMVFLSGFTPLFLYTTGMVIWWRKRRPRLREQGR